MIYFDAIIGIAVGMGVFIFGMNTMSSGLERAAGGKMHKVISRFTGNRISGAATGAISTAIVHSSTAITVMAVSFTDAGILSLHQAASVIIGANIGTTVTGLLVALNSLNISLYLMTPVVAGVIMLVSKRQNVRRAGYILCGLGLIFVGLDMMSSAVVAVSETTAFKSLFSHTSNPIIMMIIGALITAVIQSSTAVNTLVIALVAPAGLDIADAVFIILGTNIGTCVTSMAASFGASLNARRAAMIHMLFNVIGSVLFGAVFMLLGNKILVSGLGALFGHNVKFQIAWFNFFQNLATAIIVLPFIKQLVRLSELLVRDKNGKRSGIKARGRQRRGESQSIL